MIDLIHTQWRYAVGLGLGLGLSYDQSELE